MIAVTLEELEVNDQIVVHEGDNLGHHNFAIYKVVGKEENCIISNLNGGVNIYPNDEGQYFKL